MGLTSKTTITKWNVNNKKWYEDKGYVFTKYKDEFEVKVKDLPNSSSSLVNVSCDCKDCTTPIKKPMKWQTYKKYIKEGEKYYCRNCMQKIFGVKTRIKNKLNNDGKSFYDWCIENNRQDVLDRWNYNLNNCSPKDILYNSNKKYYFKCLIHSQHKSELKQINKFTNGQEGSIKCNQCNSFAQWGIDNICNDFLEKYWDYDKNDELGINPWEISYGSIKKVYIKCQQKDYHNSYDISCTCFTSQNQRCPYCSNNHGKVHPLDSLGKLLEDKGLLDIWSKRNKKSPYEYTPNNSQKVYWMCLDEKHEDYYRSISSSNYCEFRCPECVQEMRESILEQKVKLFLELLGYNVLQECNCTIIPRNPKNNHPLPFDNEILLKNGKSLLCEVHGIQHYQTTTWDKKTIKKYNSTLKKELFKRKVRDRYKRIYAKSQGYEYLEIPYWTDDKLETYKQLINNKINQIV